MKRHAATAAVLIALAAPATAGAAPLSPSAQFAYNTAVNRWGGSGCASVDAQLVSGPPEIVATFSQPGEPCYVNVTAGGDFAKVCKALVYVVGTWHGVTIGTERVPRICLSRSLFLLNHPGYLR